MSNTNIPITQDMVNAYHLYKKTPKAQKDNLFRIWENDLKTIRKFLLNKNVKYFYLDFNKKDSQGVSCLFLAVAL